MQLVWRRTLPNFYNKTMRVWHQQYTVRQWIAQRILPRGTVCFWLFFSPVPNDPPYSFICCLLFSKVVTSYFLNRDLLKYQMTLPKLKSLLSWGIPVNEEWVTPTRMACSDQIKFSIRIHNWQHTFSDSFYLWNIQYTTFFVTFRSDSWNSR